MEVFGNIVWCCGSLSNGSNINSKSNSNNINNTKSNNNNTSSSNNNNDNQLGFCRNSEFKALLLNFMNEPR